ncbi:MAG: preprotein translocase subunit SecG [Zetaproteobacteria bacterium]|nr:preprotein translocase subunit SecG [Zetaproteobacteria bacterium]
MATMLMVFHVIVAVLLIGVVLVQRGQGADIGASFGGGGAQTLFGSRGSGSFLGKMTGALAAIFMVTSLTLAFFTQQESGSVVDRAAVPAVQQESLPDADASQPLSGSALKAEESTPAATDALPAAE